MAFSNIEDVRKLYNDKKSTNVLELMEWCINSKPISLDDYKNQVLEDIFTLLDFNSNDDVLDVGCGCGILLDTIEEKCKSTLGIELSKNLIKNKVCKTKILEGDLLKIKLDHKFTKIICYSVALHFPKMNYFIDTLDKTITLLRNNGIALIGDLQWQNHNKYFSPDWNELIPYLSEKQNIDFQICSQSKIKRSLNSRINLIIKKLK